MADNDIKIQGSIEIDASGAVQGQQQAATAIKGTGDALEQTQNKAATATGLFGKLKTAIKETSVGFEVGGKAAGGLNNGLLLISNNPIVKLFTFLAKLIEPIIEHFKKMEGVSDALNKAFATFSGVVNVLVEKALKPLIDTVVKAVGFLSNLFTTITNFFSSDAAKAGKALGEINEALDDLNDTEADSILARAESNRLLQEAREITADANVPIKERIEALKKAGKIEFDELTNSIAINTKRAELLMNKLALEIGARQDVIDKIKSGNLEQMIAARAELMLDKSINKDKLKEIDALIVAAEDSAAQRAKINKKVISGEKSLLAEQERNNKEAADKVKNQQNKAAAEHKKYLELKRKLTNDNEQALITDQQTLDIAKQREQLAQQKKQIEDINVSAEKKRELIKLAETSFANEEKKIREKFQKEKDDKEKEAMVKFNDELNKLHTENVIAGIKNTRQKEEAQLDLQYAEKFEKAKEQYKNDAAKLNQIQAELATGQRIAQQNLEQKWHDEDEAKRKEKEKQQSELAGNILDKGLSPEELELQKLDETYKKKFEIAEGNEALMTETIRAYEDERNAIKQASADKQLGIATGLAGTVSDVIGKETAVGKSLAIAEATINTYLAASQVLRDPKATLLQKIAGVATALATGFKTVKGIQSTQVPKSGGAGGGSSSASVAAPITPQVASTQLNAGSIQGIGNAASSGVNRSFVVESDITNSQQRLAAIQRAARLG